MSVETAQAHYDERRRAAQIVQANYIQHMKVTWIERATAVVQRMAVDVEPEITSTKASDELVAFKAASARLIDEGSATMKKRLKDSTNVDTLASMYVPGIPHSVRVDATPLHFLARGLSDFLTDSGYHVNKLRNHFDNQPLSAHEVFGDELSRQAALLVNACTTLGAAKSALAEQTHLANSLKAKSLWDSA